MTKLVSNFECLFWFCCQPTSKSDLKEVQLTQNYLFWVKASLKYLEGATNFKTQPQLKKITIPIIQNSTLNSPFDALSKWHDPDLWQLTNLRIFLTSIEFLFLNSKCKMDRLTRIRYLELILWDFNKFDRKLLTCFRFQLRSDQATAVSEQGS